VTFRAVADMVVARAGRPVEIAPSPRQNPPTHRHFDTTNLLRAFPGARFKPLDEGLAATLANVRASEKAARQQEVNLPHG
jgi:nucleoside-diphosphate-sugar epimerase